MVQLINALFGAIYQSLGCTREMLQSGMIHIAISLIAILVGSFLKNIEILSACVAISMFLKFFIESWFLIHKCFKYSLINYFKNFIFDIVSTIVLILIGNLFFSYVGVESIWGSLFLKLITLGVMFLILLCISGQYKFFIPLIPKKIRNMAFKKRDK